MSDSDLDLKQAMIDSPTNPISAIATNQDSPLTPAMALSNCQWFELDVVEVYGCHYHYGLVVSNIDKMLSMIPHSEADYQSHAENASDAMVIVDEVVNECYCIERVMQLTKVLNDENKTKFEFFLFK